MTTESQSHQPIPSEIRLQEHRQNSRFEIPVQIGENTYNLHAQEILPENPEFTRDTLIVFTHGAVAPPLQPVDMYKFWQDQFKDAGFATLVYQSRGVGGDVKSDGDYREQSINDKVDDLVATLFFIESTEPRSKYILSGMSMGADVTVRAVQKLREHTASDNEVTRSKAITLLQKIQGFMFFAPAAYRDEVVDLPAGNPEVDKNIPGTRSYLLRHPQGPLWESSIFDTLDGIHMHHPIPVFLGIGEKDVVTHNTVGAYAQRVYRPEDFVVVPDQEHPGLLSEKAFYKPNTNTQNMFGKAQEFAKKIDNDIS